MAAIPVLYPVFTGSALTGTTPFSVPGVQNPPRFIGVAFALNMPALTSGAYPTAAATYLSGVLSGSGGGTSGQVSGQQIALDVATQQFIAAETVQANGQLLIMAFIDGEIPVNS